METSYFSSSTTDILCAAELLRSGEVVAFPTETVYGLGAVVWNEEAIQKIFTAKHRPADNPLIIHCADHEQIDTVVREFPSWVRPVAEHFMPGALTMLFLKHRDIPMSVTAGLETVAVRIPAHPVAQALIRAVGVPIVAPSANRSGRPSPTQAHHVMNDMQGRIAAVIDGGECRVGIESTVISLLETPYRILRPGSITKQELEDYTGNIFVEYTTMNDSSIHALPAPGMKYRHYAPDADVQVFADSESAKQYIATTAQHRTYMVLEVIKDDHHTERSDAIVQECVTEQTLYEQLRRADDMQVEKILIIFPLDLRRHRAGLWNRISKAAENHDSRNDVECTVL